MGCACNDSSFALNTYQHPTEGGEIFLNFVDRIDFHYLFTRRFTGGTSHQNESYFFVAK